MHNTQSSLCWLGSACVHHHFLWSAVFLLTCWLHGTLWFLIHLHQQELHQDICSRVRFLAGMMPSWLSTHAVGLSGEHSRNEFSLALMKDNGQKERGGTYARYQLFSVCWCLAFVGICLCPFAYCLLWVLEKIHFGAFLALLLINTERFAHLLTSHS